MAPFQSPNNNSPFPSNEDLCFEIRQYLPKDRDQVLSIIGNGFISNAPVGHPLHDFWIKYAQNQLTDVADVPGHYWSPGSNFFVITATIAASSGEKTSKPIVVATTAVERQSDSVAELRRVSVKLEFQRFGLGRKLLTHVHQWAKEQKFDKVLACTAIKHLQAVKFYESLGYTVTHNSVWNADPFIEVSHFEKLI